MRITPYRIPDTLLIMPNLEHVFGDVQNETNPFEIMSRFPYKDIAEIYLTRIGALGLRFFGDGPLASITRLKPTGSGMVPEYVMENHDQTAELQGRRLVFANFIAAALFGRISTLRHSSLTGAQYAGMDEILVFRPNGNELLVENSRHLKAILAPKLRVLSEESKRIKIVEPDEIEEAVAFAAHVAEREDELEYANLQACMVMNYQAAILQREQHAAASLALNFAVAEALVHEIFLSYGIVGDRTPKAFATQRHTVAKVPNKQFSDWKMKKRVDVLSAGGLIDLYLAQRLQEARNLRNQLMHGAATVTVRQASEFQSVIRELWSYVLDSPFELLTGWSMRI